MNDLDAQMVIFLRGLADSIENKSLDVKKLQQVGEFFMSFLFQEQLEKPDNEEKEFLKFLVLGWWIYTHIEKIDF
jgi:hypothetical protein